MKSQLFIFVLLLVVVVVVIAASAAASAAPFLHHLKHDRQQQQVKKSCTVADIQSAPNNASFALRAMSGLVNRPDSKSSSSLFTLRDYDDQSWWNLIVVKKGLCPTIVNQPDPVKALAYFFNAGITRNIILYDGVSNDFALPSVATLCGTEDAVPLDSELHRDLISKYPTSMKNTKVILDTVNMWSTMEDAVNYTIQHALPKTTSLSFDRPQDVVHGDLVDWVVRERLFSQYMKNVCLPLNRANKLLQTILNETEKLGNWERPVKVYGYNGQDQLFGGDLFEAETDCFGVPHVMGQIASSGLKNAAFWSNLRPFDKTAPRGSPLGPLEQPKPRNLTYDENKVYFALLSGDNDNLAFVYGCTRGHMQYRQQRCAANKSECFPFTWTMSPHTAKMLPELLRWYYDTAAESGGLDTFGLPPSGWLYSYPSWMPSDVQDKFVNKTNDILDLMDGNSVENWNWFFAWEKTFKNYLPRYIQQVSSGRKTAKNFFMLQVPWVFDGLDPLFPSFKVIGDVHSPETNVVAFNPMFSWDNGDGGGGYNYNASHVAARVNALKPGTIEHIYAIQQTKPETIFEMVSMLDRSRIEVVSCEELGIVARQKAIKEANALKKGKK